MADDTLTLFLPCDVVRFRAIVDFGPGVSPVEEIVLQALAACPLPVEELTALLALPRQVIARVVHALWRLGHLAAEPGSGKLKLARETLDAVTGDNMAALIGAEREECIIELMIDPLLGQALPPGFKLGAPRPQRVDPPHGDADLSEIPIADLWRAATQALQARPLPSSGDLGAARNRRVVDLRPEPSRPGRRWRPVLVQPWLDEDTGRLGVAVVDRRVPPKLRETGSARLTQLIADYPKAPFTGPLRARAMSGILSAPPTESLADTLTERAAGLSGLPPGQRFGRHEQLIETATHLAHSLEWRIGLEVQAELVTGGPLIQAAVDLINRSHTQVVIVASRLRVAALHMLGPPLRAALQRGVQVVVLLGEESPQTTAALFELARAGGPGPLVLPRQAIRAHAGLVVRDDEAALVLAGAVLAADNVLGVLLSALDGGVCLAVRDVLPWIGSVTPDWTTAKAILSRPSGQEPDAAMSQVGRLDQMPEAPPSDSTDDTVVFAWEAAWQAYAAWQREVLETRPLPQARWVAGANNQEMLWRALRTAQRRLVIASPLISDRIVDDRFLALLRGRLSSGVMVTLAHRSTDRSGATALDVLAAEFPERLLLVEATTEARALVWDDDAVLLPGDLLAVGAAASRSLLGLRLTGAAIADQIASAVGEPPIVTGQVTSTRALGARPELLERIRLFNTAQRIRNRWHEDNSIERALEPLVADGDPWSVLEGLIGEFAADHPPQTSPWHTREPVTADRNALAAHAAQGRGDELVCAAAAWCLATRSDVADAATTDRWRQWLIQYHWRAGRFAEAALLRVAHPLDATPRPPLTVVAAAFGTDVSTMALLTALEEQHRSRAEDACLLSVAVAEALRTADDDHAEIVGRLTPRAGAPWRNLGAAALEYHAAARGIPPELLLRPVADRAARSRRVVTAWDALARAIDRAQRTQADFVGLRRLQVALFKRSGPFGALEAATDRRDPDAVRGFLSSHSAFYDSDDQTVRRIIDEISSEATTSPIELQGGRRKALATRLAAILAAARTVLEAEENVSRDRTVIAAATHQNAARALTKRIRELSAALEMGAAELGYPEASLAKHALERIARMTEPEVP